MPIFLIAFLLLAVDVILLAEAAASSGLIVVLAIVAIVFAVIAELPIATWTRRRPPA